MISYFERNFIEKNSFGKVFFFFFFHLFVEIEMTRNENGLFNRLFETLQIFFFLEYGYIKCAFLLCRNNYKILDPL